MANVASVVALLAATAVFVVPATLPPTATSTPPFVSTSTATVHPTIATSTALPDRSTTFAVDSRLAWHDTGIDVQKGDLVQIWYKSGSWTAWKDVHPYVGPAGYEGIMSSTNPNHPLPSAFPGVLIGKVGNSDVLKIGKFGQFYSGSDGRLLLQMNDDTLTDNDGIITVTIIVVFQP